MSRYARLLTEDHHDPDAAATPTPPPPSAFSPRFATNDDTDAQPSGKSRMSSMFASLKESATSAGGKAREGMSKIDSSVRTGLGLPGASGDEESLAPSEASGVLEEVSEYCPKLTYQQRVMGFGICFGCGYLMTFMSFRLFIKLVEGNPAPFVFLYSSGNLLSLLSSMFLSGPSRQFKSMFDEKRRTTSITYLVTLTCSIAICFIPMPTGPKIGLLVLLLLVQMAASLWYTLSYVPYGRATAKRMLRSVIAMDE